MILHSNLPQPFNQKTRNLESKGRGRMGWRECKSDLWKSFIVAKLTWSGCMERVWHRVHQDIRSGPDNNELTRSLLLLLLVVVLLLLVSQTQHRGHITIVPCLLLRLRSCLFVNLFMKKLPLHVHGTFRLRASKIGLGYAQVRWKRTGPR